jgi:hypothetical protein
MPQLFHPSMNTVARVSIFGAIGFVAVGIVVGMVIVRSPYVTEAGVVREQPVPFSHRHHVGDVGLDCRYCHTSVEKSSFAGIPSTDTCLNCHSQLFADSAILAPVRQSFQSKRPLRWTRVNDVPDFVYFNHSVHIHAAVTCVRCHGPMDEMPLTWREHSLSMQWCLDCHRDAHSGVPAHVFSTSSGGPAAESAAAAAQVQSHGRITCYACHR